MNEETERAVLEAIERAPTPMVRPDVVAETLDVATQTANRYLRTLHEEGKVERVDTGVGWLYAVDSDLESRFQRIERELGLFEPEQVETS